jgi:hypothetical protein
MFATISLALYAGGAAVAAAAEVVRWMRGRK